MARSIQDLPDEISTQILGYLDTSALKNARLASRKLAGSGCRWLFRRVFFAPHKAIMTIFSKIAHEPAFAIGVEELVYDARLFWPEITDPIVYDTIYRDTVPYTDHELTHRPVVAHRHSVNIHKPPHMSEERASHDETRVNISYRQYLRLLKEQEGILRREEDFHTLCGGLQKFPNLNSIVIIPYRSLAYQSPRKPINLPKIVTKWYFEWSSQFWRDAIYPCCWYSFQDQGLENLLFPVMKTLGDSNLPRRQWDKLGLSSILRAVSLHGPLITHLQINSAFLTENLHRNQDVTASLKRVTLSLRYLRFDYYGANYLSPFRNLAGEEVMSLLMWLMRQTNILEHVLISSLPLHSSRRFFEDMYWPRLVTLGLYNIDFELSVLTGVCQRHQATLRHLVLGDITLQAGALSEDLATKLGTFLRLQTVTLIVDEKTAVYNDLDRLSGELMKLASLIMGWAPDHTLKRERGYLKASIWIESEALGHGGALRKQIASNQWSLLCL